MECSLERSVACDGTLPFGSAYALRWRGIDEDDTAKNVVSPEGLGYSIGSFRLDLGFVQGGPDDGITVSTPA
jgi:hypothetical protein